MGRRPPNAFGLRPDPGACATPLELAPTRGSISELLSTRLGGDTLALGHGLFASALDILYLSQSFFDKSLPTL